MRHLFISFRESEQDLREGFEGMIQNPTSPLRAYPISSREDADYHYTYSIRIAEDNLRIAEDFKEKIKELINNGI